LLRAANGHGQVHAAEGLTASNLRHAGALQAYGKAAAARPDDIAQQGAMGHALLRLLALAAEALDGSPAATKSPSRGDKESMCKAATKSLEFALQLGPGLAAGANAGPLDPLGEDPRRVAAAAYGHACCLDPAVANGAKLAGVLGVAWWSAAEALLGDGAAVAKVQRELARVVTKAPQGGVASRPSSFSSSSSSSSSSSESVSKTTRVVAAEGGEAVPAASGGSAGAWWGDRERLRRVLRGLTQARARESLLDRVTIVIPGTSCGGLPVPKALSQFVGADGPVAGGWWTLAATSDTARFHGLFTSSFAAPARGRAASAAEGVAAAYVSHDGMMNDGVGLGLVLLFFVAIIFFNTNWTIVDGPSSQAAPESTTGKKGWNETDSLVATEVLANKWGGNGSEQPDTFQQVRKKEW
jgi:hypothetical protein